MPSTIKLDLSGLINAITQATAEDSLSNPLNTADWNLLSAYIQPMTLAAGQTLFMQGASERTLYFVESGSLSVHYEDEKERLRLAIVTAGSVVGEGAFFSHRPRSATVQATAPCKLWSLTAMRFTELSNRQPAVALPLVMAVGAVIAKRMGNRRRRIATT
jgi:CRP-like cAMP-binding protein